MTPAEYVARMDGHPDEFIINEVKIRDKRGRIIPLHPNPAQLALETLWSTMEAEGIPVRIVIPKFRQGGISTYVQARLLHRLVFTPNTYAATICHEQASTIKMRDRIHGTAVRNLQTPFNVGKRNSPGQFINGSYMDCLTAGSRKAGRSQTITAAHCSEVALWTRGDMDDVQADEVLGSLLQAVPDIPDSVIILESTANGARGAFHDFSVNPPDGWRVLFLPYYMDLGYRVELTAQERALNDKLQGAWKAGNLLAIEENCKALGLTPDERAYRLGGGVNGAAVPLTALKWRRKYGLAKCRNDPQRFAQEYPANLPEAFLASGRPAFSPTAVAGWKSAGYPDAFDVPGTNGYGLCVEKPVAGRKYRVGVDVCEGREIPDDSSDYTVCVIHDPVLRRPVALYRSQETPRVAAAGIAVMLKLYQPDNEGVVVERNGPGLALLDRLVDRGINVWGSKPGPTNIGFRTNQNTRPLILTYLQDCVRDGKVGHPGFEPLVRELADAQQTRKRIDHRSGMHDDCVVAWALALAPMAFASERVQQEPDKTPDMRLPGSPLVLDVSKYLEMRQERWDQEDRDYWGS